MLIILIQHLLHISIPKEGQALILKQQMHQILYILMENWPEKPSRIYKN
jgi:hypothetical protein